MQTQVYNSFLEATSNVFGLMMDLTDVIDAPVERFECNGELDIVIGVIGDLKGEVIYRFPHETSLGMVKIMSNMEFDAVDEFVISAISEIANIISGNVLTILSEKNLTCDILPPVQGMGKENADYSLQKICCMTTSVGDVGLEIRLNPAS